MILKKPIQMLFALLKGSLLNCNVEYKLFETATAQEWAECFAAASKQGVLALAWDGVQTLPLEMQPPKELKFRWAISVDKYEGRHRKYCKAVYDLQQLYKEHGIATVQLKGVGFSWGYNHPHHREGGDIDIYTYSSDTIRMSHREANELADRLMVQMGNPVEMHGYKHSNFNFNGIPVENHKMFVNMHVNRNFMQPLNDYLLKVLDPVEVSFYDGEYRIFVPSPQFNTLFISCHAFQHYGSGIALHHLYDWATILANHGLSLPEGNLLNKKFLRAIAAFTHLCNKYLGTSIDLCGFPAGYEEMADEMLYEMLNPLYNKVVPYTNPVMIFLYKTRRFFRGTMLSKQVFDKSVLRSIMDSVVAHIKHPQTILSRGDR